MEDLALELVQADVQSERFAALKNEVDAALAIHAAVVKRLSLSQIAELAESLGVEAEFVARLLPVDYLRGSDIPAYRRHYQKILAEQTRTMMFDLFEESPAGYALLFQVFRKQSREPCDVVWQAALKVIGEYNLEPFKALSVWMCEISEAQIRRFAAFMSTSIWRNHADWPVILKMSGNVNMPKLIANLIVYGVVSLDTVWGMYTHTTEQRFSEFELKWLEDNMAGPNKMNALAMAMPLIDDDDDDEEEEEVNMEDEVADVTGTEAKPEDIKEEEEEDAVETLVKIVGYALGALSYVENKELEATLVQLANTYPTAFSTSSEYLTGMSLLMGSKFPVDDLQTVLLYWRPIMHSVLEPAWTKLSEHIRALAPAQRFETFREFMLPSLDLHSRRCDLLFEFSLEDRYKLYTDLYTRLATTNKMVKIRFTRAERNTKDVLKRLTKRDAETLIVPKLLDNFAECAWPSLNVFVNQVENYNIGKLVAQAASTKSFAPLAMDMLPLVLMEQFTVDRDATQKDGLHLSQWLRLLAQFAGDIASCHERFDFVALIKFVLHQFATGNYQLIFVIDQIARKLSGIPLESNLSPYQLLSLGSAPVVAEIIERRISEQPSTQRGRFSEAMRKDDLISVCVAALSYGFTQATNDDDDAKVLAAKQDAITNLVLLLRHFELSPYLSRQSICSKFRDCLQIGAQEDRPIDFNSLRLYDVALEDKVYQAVQPLVDGKTLERAQLSHKIRVKSVKQRLESEPDPELGVLLNRVLLSPRDALFTSRYLLLKHVDPAPLLSRGVVLTVLNGATPLETESYAVFMTDLLRHVYTDDSLSADAVRGILATLTATILEAAVPEASFTVLSNVFSLLQRTLPVFPVYKQDGEHISRRIQLLTTMTHGDLETAVKSFHPQLLQRAKLWCDGEISVEFLANMATYFDRLAARFMAGLKA